MIDPREFRATLGRFATGVTVVTMARDGEAYGITVNAFMSVSLKPPLVAIAIDVRANAHQTLLESERFGVSILREDQEGLSNLFAGYPSDAKPTWVEAEDMPLLDGAIGHLVCRTTAQVEAGDHTIFLGHVEYLSSAEGAPLLYYRGKYAQNESRVAPDDHS